MTRYCYPFTLRDGCEPVCVALRRAGGPTRYAVTRPCFERAFAEYGLPERIRSDNGPPFGGDGVGAACRTWPCGGFDSGSCRSGSRRAIPSRTGRTSNFTRAEGGDRRGRPPRPRARSSVGLIALLPRIQPRAAA